MCQPESSFLRHAQPASLPQHFAFGRVLQGGCRQMPRLHSALAKAKGTCGSEMQVRSAHFMPQQLGKKRRKRSSIKAAPTNSKGSGERQALRRFRYGAREAAAADQSREASASRAGEAEMRKAAEICKHLKLSLANVIIPPLTKKIGEKKKNKNAVMTFPRRRTISKLVFGVAQK